MTTLILAYLGTVLILSVASFALYGFDKSRAVHGGRRVPERTLLVLGVLGGWPGAILGQQFFRHKTKKFSFQFVFWSLTILHVALVGAALYRGYF
ncbi:MAG: DUF1294 domain-containing protein [Bacteroidales bacterium]|nr:DUF1294 domain-containing protein [Bacteroidales bacterium]